MHQEAQKNDNDLDNNHNNANYAENNIDEPQAPKIDYLSEIQKYKDNWIRAAAEIENVKRIAKQDIEKAAFYSIEKFAKDLVMVFENLCRASDIISDEDVKTDPKLQNFKEGIELTKQEMLSTLERNNVKRIHPPKGEKFNHNLHQAISQIESDQEAGNIIEVVQAGYIIKDRLLKPAMVVVSKAKTV